MKLHTTAFWIAAFIVLSGCATVPPAQHVLRWDSLKLGMTALEVRELLGQPDSVIAGNPRLVETLSMLSSKNPSESQATNLVPQIATVVFTAMIMGEELSEHDRWSYGVRSRKRISDHAFVVYFDTMGKVIRFERPLKGRYSAK